MNQLQPENSTLEEDKLLTIRTVAALIDRSIGWVYKRVGSGDFPAPYKHDRASYWSNAEVQEWIANVKSPANRFVTQQGKGLPKGCPNDLINRSPQEAP